MSVKLAPIYNLLAYLFLLSSLLACGENFSEEPPFTDVQDTVRLDVANWYYFSPEPEIRDQVKAFPFSYQLFDAYSEGHLLSSDTRLYYVALEDPFIDRVVMLDLKLSPGDTIFKYSDNHYHLLLDKALDSQDGEVYYIMRRSKKGVKLLEERSVWVMSMQKGIVAVANYDIDYRNGQVTLDMIGDPDYFRGAEFMRRLKYYDYDRAYQVDRDRNIIYEFNKQDAVLRSKDFLARKELFRYEFARGSMKELTDFRIHLQNKSVQLIAGDSCFYFSESLELQRSAACPQ